MIDLQHCRELDASDPLASLRESFDLPAGQVYLDGNSLGAMPRDAMARAQQLMAQEWGNDLIQSWNTAGWFELPLALGERLAPLIGAQSGEVAVTDSTSVNLFKAMAGALQMQQARPATAARRVIVSERSNFPTDLYILQGLTQWLDRGYEIRLVDSPDALPAAIDQDVAAVLLTHVNYRSGHMLDMAGLTRHAHAQGALIVWDLCHSAGAVPLALNEIGPDFAVGCTYKYLNGGPGAPAFIWVPRRHQAQFSQPLSGWWGHRQPFDMQPDFVGTADIRAVLCGTQPIISLALVETGLSIFEQTSMTAIRQKSLALTDLFIALVEQRCERHPLQLETPREHARRGSQVSLSHPHGYAVMQALIARGVVGDYRDPDIMRFGFTPLYTRYVDVWTAVDSLADILDRNAYDPGLARQAVT